MTVEEVADDGSVSKIYELPFLSAWIDRPDKTDLCFETMLSSPIRQACRNRSAGPDFALFEVVRNDAVDTPLQHLDEMAFPEVQRQRRGGTVRIRGQKPKTGVSHNRQMAANAAEAAIENAISAKPEKKRIGQ